MTFTFKVGKYNEPDFSDVWIKDSPFISTFTGGAYLDEITVSDGYAYGLFNDPTGKKIGRYNESTLSEVWVKDAPRIYYFGGFANPTDIAVSDGYVYGLFRSSFARKIGKYNRSTLSKFWEKDAPSVPSGQGIRYPIKIGFSDGAIYCLFDNPTGWKIGKYNESDLSEVWIQDAPTISNTFPTEIAIATCNYSISPVGQAFSSDGGTGSVDVTAPNGCTWAAISNYPSWITITSSGSENGNGTVGFEVSQNTSTGSREGSMTIAGQSFDITQGGISNPQPPQPPINRGCSIKIYPKVPSPKDNIQVTVAWINPDCCTNVESQVTVGDTNITIHLDSVIVPNGGCCLAETPATKTIDIGNLFAGDYNVSVFLNGRPLPCNASFTVPRISFVSDLCKRMVAQICPPVCPGFSGICTFIPPQFRYYSLGSPAVSAVLITGSTTTLSQNVDTPSTPFNLEFDYWFGMTTGSLDVILGGTLLGTIVAPLSLDSEIFTASFQVDGALLNQSGLPLNFILDGSDGSTVLIDNINLPGLSNGNFQTGDLTGWVGTASGEGFIGTISSEIPPGDLDGDGFAGEQAGGDDCDDNDDTVYPGSPELCDGKDNDCDGVIPSNEIDGDGDGFSVCQGDCDDNDPTVYPEAPELCDGKDNDCDGAIPASELDEDGDGIMVCEGDVCPSEDATGYDVDYNGCIDSSNGLVEMVNTLVIGGVIDENLQNSLISKVENAEKSLGKDNICAAVSKIEAFINQVNAQKGKKISEEAADQVIAYAGSVINYMLGQLPDGESC